MKTKLHIVLIFTLSFVWLMVLQVVCQGATYYVATTGDDANSGTSDAPWRTIAKAFQTATYGDTVYIRNGNYGEINNPIIFPVYTGSMTEPLPSDTQFITFKADEEHEPVFTRIELGDRYSNYYVPYIFEGIRIEPEAGFSGAVLTQCVGTRLKHLTIAGQSLAAGYGVELGYGRDYVSKNNDIRIEDCIIHTFERGIHGYGSNIAITGNEIYNIGSDHVQVASGGVSGYNIVIENNHIHHTNKVDPLAHPDGIALADLTNVIIRNNIIHDLNATQGIFDHGNAPLGSKNVLIENNLMYKVAVTELQFHSSTTATENWTLRNNTIIGSGIVQLVTLNAGSNHNVYNNIFVCAYGALAGAVDYHDHNIYVKKYTSNFGDTEPNSYGYDYLGDWDSTHAVIEPELFVDPANKDFRLKEECRAVDFGDPDRYPATDLLGNPRDDGAPDAGCYEYGASSPSNQPPIANAGQNQTVTDTDANGSEEVTLDGSGSKDPDGTIVSFIWSEGGSQIATGINPTVTLSTGEHLITLTVTDNGGLTDTDTVTIKVLEGDKEFGKLPTGCYNNVIEPLKGEKAIIMGEIEKRGYVKISLYDTKGKKIRKLADEERDAGPYKYYWEGKNDSGNVVGSGLYFVHIQAGDYKKTKKIVVVK